MSDEYTWSEFQFQCPHCKWHRRPEVKRVRPGGYLCKNGCVLSVEQFKEAIKTGKTWTRHFPVA